MRWASITGTHLERLLRIITLFLLAIGLILPSASRAQSITSGGVRGMVRDAAGSPLANARVEVTDRTTGFARSQFTSRDGGFAFTFLAPGEYDLITEQLGYLPVEVQRIRVVAGDEASVTVDLEAAEPPVLERTVRDYEAAVLSPGLVGPRWPMGTLELRRLPDESRDLASVARFTSFADPEYAFEGLPARFARVTLDGIPFQPVEHPIPGQFAGSSTAFPLTSVQSASVDLGGADVEWAGGSGARVSALSRRGTRRLETSVFGDWTGAPLTRSKYYEPQDLSGNSIRGGLLVSGPVIRDTAHFVLGFEARRLQIPLPPRWEPTTADSSLLSVAQDSFALDLSDLLAPRVGEVRSVSGFGRVDWQASDRNRLSVFAHGALLDGTDPPIGTGRIASPVSLEGTDILAGATLTSAISPAFALELRASFESSRREYTVGDTALTLLVPGPLAFGTDQSLPGRFERTAFRVVETAHLTLGRHHFKLGGGGGVRAYDDTYVYGRPGEFVFGDADSLGTRQGAFVQTVGRIPLARYTTTQVGGFIQDRWRATPGFDLLLGLRVDAERFPADKLLPNTAWLAQSGLPNDTLGGSGLRLSPRVGFVWDVAERHRWIVRAEGGVYHDLGGGDAFAEAVATATGVDVRRGVGTLNRWPLPPDSVSAPVQGPRLAILEREFTAPRTARGEFGLSGSLGGGTALHLAASYRHTDFLVRRHDLNLIQAPVTRDQHGRPVYGTLAQSGGALFAEPGSNRRFDGFDVVTALDQDGYSDYVGITARLDKRVGRAFTFSAGYTFSRTEDNWFGARGGPDAQLTPFPDSLNGADWADGRSDFDVPHRFVLGAEVDLRSVRLAAFYGFRSGYPFTPGFRDGVDANGDGSWRNDPAFVDEAVTGVTDLYPAWACLQGFAGRFVERNACRGPSVQRLDLRLILGPFRLGYPVELVVDALNLLDAEYADVDRALYLVDPAGALVTDPATGEVTVPLVANPDFGRVIRRYGTGRVLRLGLRVNYE